MRKVAVSSVAIVLLAWYLIHPAVRSACIRILLKRKCVREERGVDGNNENGIWHRLYNVTV